MNFRLPSENLMTKKSKAKATVKSVSKAPVKATGGGWLAQHKRRTGAR